MHQSKQAHFKEVRAASEQMARPCKLEDPHRSRVASELRHDRGLKSPVLRIPRQCWILMLLRPVRQLTGSSLEARKDSRADSYRQGSGDT